MAASRRRAAGAETRDMLPSLARVEAERSILGAILLVPSTYRLTAPLRLEDFHLPSHRMVFRRMRGLADASSPIDQTTLIEELDRHGELEGVGGPGIISGLIDGVPDNSNVAHYVKQVREAAELRKLYTLTESIPESVKSGGGLNELIAHIEKTLEGPRRVARRLTRKGAAKQSQGVSGAQILDELAAFLSRFVDLTPAQTIVVALWIVHTHAIDASAATPYLAITSAEKQSGKTRLLEVLNCLVANSWFTGRVTGAVLVRKVDMSAPTLLLDETDAAFGGEREYSEGLRGILNTGHRRGATSSLCVGKGNDIQPKDFHTFCPKALAGIGKLPDTIADRSLPIRLKRKIPGEGLLERFRARLVEPEGQKIHDSVAAWVDSHWNQLDEAEPILPEALTDRQQDGAEPLLAIADLAGGGWAERARKALVEILSGKSAEDQSITTKLLGDIRQVFDERGVDRLSSLDLVAALVEIETSPWAEINRGRPLTAPGLSRLLRGHEIAPRTIRLRETTLKGYFRESFEDSWKRHLPSGMATAFPSAEQPSQPSQSSNDAALDVSPAPSQNMSVTVSENKEEPVLTRVVTDVSPKTSREEKKKGSGTMLKGEL